MLASGLEGQPTLYRSEAPNEWTYMATLPDPDTLMALLIDSGHALGENYRNLQPDQPADAGEPTTATTNTDYEAPVVRGNPADAGEPSGLDAAERCEHGYPLGVCIVCDVPADAGEPNTRPRCSHTRLVKDRCPICGPLDDDSRPVTDGDTPAPDAAAIGLRQQISDAREQVAAWPKWMTNSAKVHEPSCCARTREECAQVADAYPKHEPFGAEHTAHGSIREEQDSASRDIAAAIRRTDNTGGRDE
jgi:hypothetical protein